MEIRKQFRMRLLGIAAGVLTALLIWPGTRWVVLAQVARLIPGRPSAAAWAADITGHRAAGSEGAARAAHAAAGGLPDVYSIQLADALAPGPYGTLEYEVRTAHLRDLARRFPDRPSVYANVLRFATMGAVLMHRDEELLLVPSASGAGVPKRRAIDPGKLAVYDRDAAEGERLDPDNAYFPVMRAAGLRP